MEIIIRGEPKEIAALVLELQERRTMPDLPGSTELRFDKDLAVKTALATIRGMREANKGANHFGCTADEPLKEE